MFQFEVFRKQMFCIEESTCDIDRNFRRPPWRFGAPILIWGPGNCVPLAPSSLRPCALTLHLNRFRQIDNQQYYSYADSCTAYQRWTEFHFLTPRPLRLRKVLLRIRSSSANHRNIQLRLHLDSAKLRILW